ncbi:hypothetical protein DND36_29695 [Pseudomonas savastanoi pv. glycinea]|nr:hypothetical protein DND36_29695 [Pseudomonas savastanoi pv. glycinea]
MRTSFPCNQARRRPRRLLALAALDHNFVITKNGRESCRLIGISAEEKVAYSDLKGFSQN